MKLIQTLLALSIAGLVLAGCNKNEEAPADGAAAPEAVTPAPEAAPAAPAPEAAPAEPGGWVPPADSAAPAAPAEEAAPAESAQ